MARYTNPRWVKQGGCWYYGDETDYFGSRFHLFPNASKKITVRVPNVTGTGGEILEMTCDIETAKTWVEIEASNHV